MIIYKATNIVNGKSYIGKTTKNFEKYKKSHIKYALNERDIKYGHEKIFYDAIRKYGFENFQWEVIKECKNELMLNLMETFMIMVHHSHISEGGYNMTWGGDGGNTYDKSGENNPFYGKIHTKETINIIKEKCKQHIPWNKGKINIYSDETKKKMSLSKLGKTHSNEYKQKLKTIYENYPDDVKRKISREKSYNIIFPDGHSETIKGLKRFCICFSLNYNKMKKYKQYNNYKII